MESKKVIFYSLFPIIISCIIFMIKTANPSSNTEQKEHGVIKIFMNYAQIFTLASSLKLLWYYINLFDRQKEFSSPKMFLFFRLHNRLDILWNLLTFAHPLVIQQ